MSRTPKKFHVEPTPTPEEIAAYIAEHGVEQCPPCAAAILGNSTPGWRRDMERKSDTARTANFGRSKKEGFNTKAKTEHMIQAEHLGAPAYVEGHRAVFKRVRTAQRKGPEVRVYCRYFDKLCLITVRDDDASAQAVADNMTHLYRGTGARFYVSREFTPTFMTFKGTVRPLLLRALRRQAQQQRAG